MKHLKSLSIFFPCYNDGGILPSLIEKTYQTAKQITDEFEIICVNDGSKDNTKEVLEELQKKYKELRIINHQENRGYGGALISGFENSKKEWVFYTDGDGQYDPGELKKLVQKADKNIDVINGYKVKRADGFVRNIVGSLNNIALHILFPLPIRDIDCDFRLIRNSLIKKIHLSFTSATILPELVVKLHLKGARFAEIPVSHYPRKYGKSRFFNYTNITKAIVDNISFFIYFKIGKI